jgi:hypothetical protein
LKLRDPKEKRTKAQPQAEKPVTPPTGLNYVELIYEEHRRQIRETTYTDLGDLKNVLPGSNTW